mgnify:CR=1 FL=1
MERKKQQGQGKGRLALLGWGVVLLLVLCAACLPLIRWMMQFIDIIVYNVYNEYIQKGDLWK